MKQKPIKKRYLRSIVYVKYTYKKNTQPYQQTYSKYLLKCLKVYEDV